jgi:hypothetical protein
MMPGALHVGIHVGTELLGDMSALLLRVVERDTAGSERERVLDGEGSETGQANDDHHRDTRPPGKSAPHFNNASVQLSPRLAARPGSTPGGSLVSRRHGAYLVADGDDLRDALVSDRKVRPEVDCSVDDAAIQIACRRCDGMHDRFQRTLDLGVRALPPLECSCLDEMQCSHWRHQRFDSFSPRWNWDYPARGHGCLESTVRRGSAAGRSVRHRSGLNLSRLQWIAEFART